MRALDSCSVSRSGWRRSKGSSISNGGLPRPARSPTRARTSTICRSCTAPILGRCYAALRALPRAQQDALDPASSFELIRRHVIAYVRDDLLAAEINAFDAALALLALAKLGADPNSFAPALSCIARSFGRGRSVAHRSKPMSGTR